ncbi:hypothetical protein HYV72_01845, partial [Candidatus Uhrbacteria bacterium]|nr:hypothetical protein [Candidatus Uhrbacteria bacterium]
MENVRETQSCVAMYNTNKERAAAMKSIERLAACLIAVGILASTAGCWALAGTPYDTAATYTTYQRGNVEADYWRRELALRDESAARYFECLDRGFPGWKCEQYLNPAGYGFSTYGLGLQSLNAVARDSMIEVHLAEGARQDFSQNAAIRGLREDVGAEASARAEGDRELSVRVKAAQAKADEANGKAGAAHGRLDHAAREMRSVNNRAL